MSSSPRPGVFGMPSYVWKILLAAAVLAVALLNRADAADYRCKPYLASVAPVMEVRDEPPVDSWVFRRSRYTHDPATGARVAQYSMKPPVEPLDDPRLVTSGYSRSRMVLRGANGSADTTYRVQSYGNGRGGMDAEWERFHDAWRGATVGGGYFQSFYQPYGYGGYPVPYGAYGPGGYSGGGRQAPYAGPAYGRPFFAPGFRGQQAYGPGFGAPDAGLLDPDAADGYVDPRRRTPDSQFFNGPLPPRERHDRRGMHTAP